jgi:hypothetical protein
MPCSWKTYLKNFVKTRCFDVSRVTGFPKFPNRDILF